MGSIWKLVGVCCGITEVVRIPQFLMLGGLSDFRTVPAEDGS